MRITNKDRRRFWTKVFFTDPDGCWYWHGARQGVHVDGKCVTEAGHGRFKLNGVKVAAHRFVFFDRNGYLPEVVRHRCNNEICVNPKHLLPGTQMDNVQDQIKAGTHTAIKNLSQYNGGV